MMKSLLEKFVKGVIAEDLDSFLQDTKDIYYSEYSDDEVVKSGGKDVKRIWSKNVDRNFIQSLIKVHWIRTPTAEKLHHLLMGGKDEISASAYLPDSKYPLRSGWSNVGVIVDGYVTLAANSMDAIYSGFLHGSTRDPKQASSGIPKRSKMFKPAYAKMYILDRKSFNQELQGHNEVLVDNWKVKGLVLPIKSDGMMNAVQAEKKIFLELARIADEAGIPIYNGKMTKFSFEEVVNSAGDLIPSQHGKEEEIEF